ncbi:GntR family transcriptional regulator [Pseudorhodobacter sp.]|uniref:GntR family transcriptional regulator n=1 Tax=Pseudorhodobacter sp. TaxID=1934400 RepID=UPI00264821D4|nr:GntR family transcriptional regulator [Pseudorhodobacter sp.]MDN5787294.1 GntR family transcriptional regulator [Pseudorhodobacter sp.]
MRSSETWAESGLDRLAPIGRETVQDRIYRQLRVALICGGFDAGEVFLAGDLATRMSVSSMPVREALARLVSERALEAMQNRRVRVPLLTIDRARDIAAARSLIESDLAQRAIGHITGDDLATLDELTRTYEAAKDPRDVAHLNHAFHFAIYEKAGSSVLLPFVESLWMQAGPYVRAAARLHSPLTDPSATMHHHGILQALRAGDALDVVRELNADIQRAFTILERAAPEFWAEQAEAA